MSRAIILSLGRTVTLDVLTDSKPGKSSEPRQVALASGDGIFFNGSVLYHGVSRVHGPETSPAFWLPKDFVRVGLQMREQTP